MPYSEVDPFEVQRQRAAQQVNQGVQNQQDALKRRFAAAGNIDSGSFVKANELANQAGDTAKENAFAGINANEAQQKYQEAQAQKQRDFQSAERVAQQGFASGEAEKQRAYATGERIAGQGFTAAQTKRAQDIQQSQFAKQNDLANRTLAEEHWVNEKNVELANKTLGQKDFLESLFNPDIGGGGIGGKIGGTLGTVTGGMLGGPLGAGAGSKGGGAVGGAVGKVLGF